VAAVCLAGECGNLVWLHRPDRFIAVDYWYVQRSQAHGFA
jgi:hypothetical protein